MMSRSKLSVPGRTRGGSGRRGLGSSGTIARRSCNRNGFGQPGAEQYIGRPFPSQDTAPRIATVLNPFGRLNVRCSLGKASEPAIHDREKATIRLRRTMGRFIWRSETLVYASRPSSSCMPDASTSFFVRNSVGSVVGVGNSCYPSKGLVRESSVAVEAALGGGYAGFGRIDAKLSVTTSDTADFVRRYGLGRRPIFRNVALRRSFLLSKHSSTVEAQGCRWRWLKKRGDKNV